MQVIQRFSVGWRQIADKFMF
uniref:Uncharacterized protein n=1 Tax=Rhizophora mucronata TaxID=61149 RepID=A0A2P2R4V7_RHIMU